MNMINIAIDGPSGAGKSTLAKEIAKKLDIYYLDTGSMYRAVAYAAINSGVDIKNTKQVEELIKKINLHTVYESGEQKLLLEGQNIMPYIRTPQISTAASDISAYPCVRLKLVAMQREVAREYDVVLDGRDIGTYVLPKARYKYFVTADIEERAKRRYEELKSKGADKPYDDVIREMKSRDNNDSTRNFAPLKQAKDAMLIDTTQLSIDEVLHIILDSLDRSK